MPIIVELRENKPGYADLEIKRWKGGAEIEIAIQRNQDRYYFSQDIHWSSEPVWHRVTDLIHVDESLQGTLGPWIVDALVQQGGNAQYLFFVKSGDFIEHGVVRFIGSVLASAAGGASYRGDDVRDTAESKRIIEPEVIPVVKKPLVEETIATKSTPVISSPLLQPERKNKKILIWILILLLLISGGVAVWWFMKADKIVESEERPEVCAVKADSDALTFIQACLKTNPDSKQLMQIIENAKKSNACDIAQRLYANKAQGGNAEIAFAYAKEYDSAFSKGDSCFKLDKDTAIYWYETGLAVNPDNAEAKKRIEELKK